MKCKQKNAFPLYITESITHPVISIYTREIQCVMTVEKRRTEFVTNAVERWTNSGRFHNHEKRRKKSLTKGEWCGKIVKLSRKARHEKETGSRPGEGIERSFGSRAKAELSTNKDLKKSKKTLDKASRM